MVSGAAIAAPPDNPLASYTFDQLWEDALRRHDLRFSPPKGDISGCKNIEDVIKILEKNEDIMKVFRARGQKIRECIKPFVNLVKLFVDTGAEAAASKAVPGGKAVFTAFGVLLAATKGVSQTYDALEDIMAKLQNSLGRLHTYLADPEVISLAMKDILVRILGQLLDVIALCSKRLIQSTKKHTFWRVLLKRTEDYGKILTGNTEVLGALNKLDKLTSEEQQRAIADILVAATLAANDVRQIQQDLGSTELRNWLSPPMPEERHFVISKSRQDGTGSWFVGRRLAAWKNTKNGVYWIHGKPGSGKSVLFSSIVDQLRSEGLLVYFYFDFRDPSKYTVRGFKLSLMYQLASRSRDCLDILKEFRQVHHASPIPPEDSEIFKCLKAMFAAVKRVYVLVDALDECPEEPRHEELLPLLENIVALRQDGLRLLVTSRPEDDVRECLLPMVSEQLSLHDDFEQAREISRYVAGKLADTVYYRDWSEKLRSQAKKVLVANAGGMFLCADLQLKSLRGLFPTTVKRYNLLDKLPDTLYGTYERILMNVKAGNASLACRVFECITFAARPLTPKELAGLFTLDSGADDDGLDSDPESWLLRICSSLIQIVKGSDGRGFVQFVHFSAQEYLFSISPASSMAIYALDSVSGHTTLSRLCLSTLNSLSSVSDQRVGNHAIRYWTPFASYAVRYWMDHVQSNEVQKAVKIPLSDFLCRRPSFFSRWLGVFVSEYRTDPSKHPLDGFSTPYPFNEDSTSLFVAVYLGLHHQIQTLLDSPDVTINSPYAPVIWASAAAGRKEMIDLLLNRGAAVDARTRDWQRPIHAAARSGDVEIAHLLLEQRPDVHARQKNGYTPLHVAAQHGRVEIARLLLGRGAAVQACGDNDWTSLHLAAKNGHAGVVSLLLEHGAAVNAYANDRLPRQSERSQWTPLHLAAVYGHANVVRLLYESGASLDQRGFSLLCLVAENGHIDVARWLLDRGTTVNSHLGREKTPLHMAAQNGREDMIRFLIEHGAAVDAAEHSGWAPLHLAAQNGLVGTVRVLLDQGASVDVRGEKGETPLFEATRKGHIDVAQVLLNRGAVVEARASHEAAPLHFAALYGYTELVRLILKRGAAVDAHAEYECTPLHAAAQNGHVEVARLLLANGADVDARLTYMPSSPLQNAAYLGKLDVVRLLLKHGADIEARYCDQSTSLYQAARQGHVGVFQHLLDCGAAFDICTESGWTILHVAASEGHVEIVQLMLQLGAKTECKNHAGRTALIHAAGRGHDAAARILLDHGASVTACDLLGFNALDHAAAGGHSAVVRLLLERGANTKSDNAPHGTCVHVAEKASRAAMVSGDFGFLEPPFHIGRVPHFLPLPPQNLSHRKADRFHDWMQRTFRMVDVRDAAQLLQVPQPAVACGDMVLHCLRRYRSVGAWGDIWRGVDGNRPTLTERGLPTVTDKGSPTVTDERLRLK